MLVLRRVAKVFFSQELGTNIVACEDVSFAVDKGEFLCLVGPSGSGKSTLINLIAGFMRPTSGSIRLDGRMVERPGPDRGVVFQDHYLFPWLTVRENVEFGLLAKGVSRRVARTRGEEQLAMVGLTEFAAARPHELSGGMRQRVALARLLALDSEILLMDEPFGALDARTRQTLQTELVDICRKRGKTVVFVTHNVEEAVYLGDRVLAFTARPGRIKAEFQIDLPRPRVPSLSEFAEYKAKVLGSLMDEAFLDRGGRGDTRWHLEDEEVGV